MGKSAALAVVLVCLVQAVFAGEPARYVCQRTAGTIEVDGRLDEESWRAAIRSNPFVDIVTGEQAWLDTRVSLLWDDQYLYFGFEVPERDVRATLTERDSKIYNDNDVEIFIAGKNAYYELEINALGTIYEVFWIWKDVLGSGSRYDQAPEWDVNNHEVTTLAGVGGHLHPRGERWGFLDWDLPGLRHSVHVDGTLNRHADTDHGWTVEVAVPWAGLEWLADGRSLPPKDGDVWRIDCSRFQHFTLEGERLQRPAGWTWNQHGHYDSHIPEVFPYVRFSDAVAGAE